MRLLLDIGNTRIKWALQSASGLSEQQALPHADMDAMQLRAQLLSPDVPVTQVLVSNVAGAGMADIVRQVVRDCWQLEAQFMSSPASATIAGLQVRNAYGEPAKLGVDRWLAMLGALALQPANALVVSVGTAMTLDAITADGRHLGGMIVPGPDLMVQTLLHNTSDIAARAADGGITADFFADNTLGCVVQGARHSSTALIAAAYARLLREQGELRLLLTGGAAAAVQSLLSVPVQLVPDLVLRGLALHE